MIALVKPIDIFSRTESHKNLTINTTATVYRTEDVLFGAACVRLGHVALSYVPNHCVWACYSAVIGTAAIVACLS